MDGKGKIQDVIELSSMQSGMLFNSMLSDNIDYLVENSFTLEGKIIEEHFRKALEILTARHDALRTIIVHEQVEKPLQVVLRKSSIDYQFIGEGTATSDIIDERATGFKASSPPWKVRLYALGANSYKFTWLYHHIILDGWSFVSLVSELLEIYYLLASSSDLPSFNEPPPSNKKYFKWFKEYEKEDSHINYWKNLLSDYNNSFEFVPNRNTTLDNNHNSLKYHSISLGPDLSDAIIQLSKKIKVTPNIVMQSIWGILICKFVNTRDVVFGSAVSGRPSSLEGVGAMIGMFVNTIPLRIRYGDETSFEELAKNLQLEFLEGEKHHQLPLNTIITKTGIRDQIFDHITVFENFPVNVDVLDKIKDKITIKGQEVYTKTNFGLTVEFNNEGGDFNVVFGYSSLSNIDSWVLEIGHAYLSIFRQAMSDTTRLVAGLSLYETEELSSIFDDSPSNSQGFFGSIVDDFEKSVTIYADRVALKTPDQAYTYQELDAYVNRLAAELTSKSFVSKGDLVGIVCDRNFNMIVSILAVLKSGGAYVPIHPNLPTARKELIVTDTGLSLIIADESFATECKSIVPKLITVNESYLQSLKEEAYDHIKLRDNDLAYVMYTSGSTGAPKGVMVEHGGVVNMVRSQIDMFGVEISDVVLQFAPFNFDASVSEMFMALLSGASLVMIEEDCLKDPNLFLDYSKQKEVNVATLPPSYMSAVGSEKLTFLKTIISAGENINEDVARQCAEFCSFYNAYGPTEYSVCASIDQVNAESKAITLGDPIANTNLFLLTDEFQPVADGYYGELYVSGAGLARGYLNNPELTHEKFLAAPFNGRRMYRTGDIARNVAGKFKFSGRQDHQVKINGHRVELEEIEKVTQNYDSVEHSVVLQSENNQLVLFVKSVDNQIDTRLLQNYLEVSLPHYMIPGKVVKVEAFPISLNGKVDRKALLKSTSIGDLNADLPDSELEHIILDCWKEVMGIDGIGVHDNYFAIGGDSILAIRVISKLTKLGYSITVRQLIEHPTVSLLAKALDTSSSVERSHKFGRVPLTPIQNYFFHKVKDIDQINAFTFSLVIHADGGLEEERLTQCLLKMIENHEALNYSFHIDGDKVSQLSNRERPQVQIRISTVDRKKDFLAQLEEFYHDLKNLIHISDGELLKVGILRGDEKDTLVLVFHHLVMDIISAYVFLEELETSYHQQNVDQSRSSSFQQWASQLQQDHDNEMWKGDRVYWEKIQSKIDADTHLIPSNEEGNIDYDSLNLILKTGGCFKIPAWGEKMGGATIESLILGAFSSSFVQVFDREEILVQMEGHGRQYIKESLNFDRTIGWFTSVYPIFFAVNRQDSIQSVVAYVKQELQSIPNKGIGYGIFQYGSQDSYPNTKASADLNFNYDGTSDTETELSKGWSIGDEAFSNEHLKIDHGIKFYLNVGLRGDDLIIDLEYNTAEISAKDAQKTIALLEETINAVIGKLNSGVAEYTATENAKTVLPVSPLQEGLLHHHLLDPRSGVYHIQNALIIHGPVDPDRFRASVEWMANRHDVFKAEFRIDESGKPVQIIGENIKIGFTFDDYSGDEQPEQRLQQLLETDLDEPYDLLGEAPLVRIGLIKVNENMTYFVLSTHHIILDAWCFEIIFNEISWYYYDKIPANELVDRKNAYLSYFNWLDNYDKEKALSFWTDYLKGYENHVNWNLYKTSNTGEFIDTEYVYDFTESQHEIIKSLSRQYGITEYLVLEAAWSILLSSYFNCTDVAFGKVLFGRPTEIVDIDRSVGLYINSVPCRIRWDEKTTLDELLIAIKEQQLQLLSNQYISLAEVQNTSEQGGQLVDHLVEFDTDINDEDHTFLNYDLELLATNDKVEYGFTIIFDTAQGFRCKIKYDGNGYSQDVINGIPIHLERIFSQLENTSVLVSQISLIGKQELKKLLESKVSVEKLPQNTVQETIAKWALIDPDATAITYAGVNLSYRELEHRSNQVANILVRNKVSPGDRIVVALPRSVEWIISVLSIFKAGAVYVPIGTDYPISRIQAILEDTVPGFMFLTQDIEHQLTVELPVWTNDVPRMIIGNDQVDEQGYVETFEKWVSSLDESTAFEPLMNSENLAYILFTSGSTGTPKGVMIEHEGMLNHLESKIRLMEMDRQSIVAQNAPSTFDISIWQFLASLMTGGRVVIIDHETIHSPKSFIDCLIRESVNVLEVVPSYMMLLLDYLEGISSEVWPKTLKYLMVTGEQSPISLLKRIKSLLPEVLLINAYGPTEASDDVTHAIVDSEQISQTVGKAIENINIYIIDRLGRLCPDGVIGEIHVSGVGVGRGYLNDVEKTARAFVPDVFDASENMYKTGDLGKILPNGEVEFLGRIDNQVKVRGQRIELGEIENQLSRLEEIAMSVALVSESHAQARLLAFIQYYPGKVLNETEVKHKLLQYIPNYMVPDAIMVIDEFPVTKNGKIDRKALLSIDSQSIDEIEFEMTSPEMEKMRSIWVEVLMIDEIGLNSGFFESGGHSLKAIQLISRVNSAFQVEIKVRDLYLHPTITSLTVFIAQLNPTRHNVIESIEDQDYYLVSHSQRRLWIMQQFASVKHTYNIVGTVLIKGQLHVEVLVETFRQLALKHEGLRTNFKQVDGEVFQIVQEEESFDFAVQVTDFSSKENPEHLINDHIIKASQYEFSLESDSLFRVDLLRNKDQYHLVLVLHHIISDAWSLKKLTNEFVEAYGQSLNGAVEVVSPKFQFRDFSAWQNRIFDKELVNEDKNFWLETFNPLPEVMDLPTDFERPPYKSNKGDIHTFTIPETIIQPLRQYCDEKGYTVFSAVMASLNVLMHHITGQKDLVFGFTSSGRSVHEFESIQGYFVNTLPLRTNWQAEHNLDDFIGLVHQNIVEALDHQIYPFDALIDELDVKTSQNRSPLFDILVEYQNFNFIKEKYDKLQGLEVEPQDHSLGISQFDLTFFISDETDKLNLVIEYDTALYKRSRIQDYEKQLIQIIEAFISSPEISIGGINLSQNVDIPKGAEHKDISHFIHWFKAQVEKHPHAMAIRQGSEEITYQQLYSQSGKLAHHIKEKFGIGANHIVPIVLDNSSDLIVSMMGVMMAGGAFLPLNPHDPAARKKLILEEVDPKLLIGDSSILFELTDIYNGNFLAVDIELQAMTTCIDDFSYSLDDLAYVIYTSGTTGRPKGVRICHRSFANYLGWSNDYYFDNQEGFNFALCTNPAFDLTLTSIFSPLMRGDAIDIFRGDLVHTFTRIFSEENEVTAIKLTPSHLTLIPPKLIEDSKLKKIILGGEAIRKNHLKILEAFPSTVDIYNEYGPTECTIGCTVSVLDPKVDTVDIGMPIWNTELLILNENNHLQVPGAFGELCVSGLGLSLGYMDIELDAHRFEEVTVAGTIYKIYRTGDRARWTYEGKLEVSGRIDRQVKFNGYRIELDEIEQALQRHSAIESCGVVIKKEVESEDLLAYFTSSEEVTEDELSSYLKRTFSSYAIPNTFIQLEELPLTTNGKVDYVDLSEREPQKSRKTEYIAPDSQVQKTLAEIMEKVLGVEGIGIEDDFFRLGGNSLKVVLLINAVEEVYPAVLSVGDVFNSGKLKDLAQLIEEHLGIDKKEQEIEEYNL